MKWVAITAVVVVVLLVGWYLHATHVANPRVIEALRTQSDATLAARVMLLTLPSGRSIPVNYLREGNKVYAGADGRWWRELVGTPARVTLLIRGETLDGRAKAVLDDPVHTEDVFKRLRPTSYKWIGGVLIQIDVVAGI